MEASTSSKPVIVRVKRKVSQTPLDAFWLEINERPLKRAYLDLQKLSLSDSAGNSDLRAKKLLLEHVETATTPKAIGDVLCSFASERRSIDGTYLNKKISERRQSFKLTQGKQEQLLSTAKAEHEMAAKNARFQQIWRSRNKIKEESTDGFINEFCHLYDIVRVDSEEETCDDLYDHETATSHEDSTILCNYLPLIREYLPEAAEEIELDITSHAYKRDEYVYDLYAAGEDTVASSCDDVYPLVQVHEEDYYIGHSDTEWETDDSNAENNPLNDYPDELASTESKEWESGSSKTQSRGSEDEYEYYGDDANFSEEEYI